MVSTKKNKIESPENYTDIGKQAYNNALKTNNDKVEIREFSNELLKDYFPNLIEAVKRGKGKYEGNYYVVVLTKRERLIAKTLRNFFFTTQACPTPGYEQAVYEFDPKDETLDFLWIIPSKDMCADLYKKRYLLEFKSDPLLPFVIDFMEGNLLTRAMLLNNEL